MLYRTEDVLEVVICGSSFRLWGWVLVNLQLIYNYDEHKEKEKKNVSFATSKMVLYLRALDFRFSFSSKISGQEIMLCPQVHFHPWMHSFFYMAVILLCKYMYNYDCTYILIVIDIRCRPSYMYFLCNLYFRCNTSCCSYRSVKNHDFCYTGCPQKTSYHYIIVYVWDKSCYC